MGLKEAARSLEARERAAGIAEGTALEIPDALKAGSLMESKTPSMGVSKVSQSGVEIEASDGAIWVIPYSTFVTMQVSRGRAGLPDTCILYFGRLKIYLSGRGFRNVVEPLREYRLVYLRSLSEALAKNAAASADKVTITKIVVIKAAKEDPDTERVEWNPEEKPGAKASETGGAAADDEEEEVGGDPDGLDDIDDMIARGEVGE